MFSIDFFALSLLLNVGIKRVFYIFFALFLLIMSLSPSGYIVFALAFAGACLFTFLKFTRANSVVTSNHLLVVLAFVVGLAAVGFALLEYGFIDYIFVRIFDPSVFESPRVYMSYMPFVWMWDSNFFSFLFGHGMKSYSIIGTAFSVPSGEPVHATSNNIYVDVFWESGAVGLALLLAFFSYVLFMILKSGYSKYQVFIALFVLFDLMFSGFFRADFASLRYFILIYLSFILTRYNVFPEEGARV